jgi:hypothetical protein
MGEFINIAESLADSIQIVLQGERVPDGGRGIEADDLEIMIDGARQLKDQDFNLYPSLFKGGCFDLAVFISLISPSYVNKRKGHLNLRQLMEKLVQHSFSCSPTTTKYLVITDNWDPKAVHEWGSIQEQIINQGKTMEIYLLSITQRSRNVYSMSF